jgi:alpha-L-arabinofuranosidase
MVNVLQAMIFTDKEKMLLTPTYHVFRMYLPFQDATFVPVRYDAGAYREGDIELPRVDAIAARDTAGKLWLSVTNLDPEKALELDIALAGVTAKGASGETLTGPKVDSVNTFTAPNTVAPRPASVRAQGGKVVLQAAPKSITVVSIHE